MLIGTIAFLVGGAAGWFGNRAYLLAKAKAVEVEAGVVGFVDRLKAKL